MSNENIKAWQQYAEAAAATEPAEPATVPERLEWTQLPGLGPGDELLGELHGRTVLELGCGTGAIAAYLAHRRGAFVTAIDAVSTQIARAQTRWSHPHLSFLSQDAATFLREGAVAPVDYVLSVFGALDFAPPDELLPVIAQRLRPSGIFALATTHPDWTPPDRLSLPTGGRSTRLSRPRPTAEWWNTALLEVGLQIVRQQPVTPPGAPHPCCLIVCATKTPSKLATPPRTNA